MKLHESIQPPVSESTESLSGEFKVAYEKYRQVRKICQEAEGSADTEKADKLLKEILEIKEQLSELIISIFSKFPSLEEFEKKLKEMLAEVGNVPIEEVNDYILGSYVYPPSLRHPNIRSPIESIWATLENLKIVAYFAKMAEKNAEGMLLSGGISHTPFLGVKGKVPEELVKEGAPQLAYREFSDIDLMLTFKNTSQMKSLVEDFVSANVFGEDELKRFKLFERLQQEGKADLFSVRSHYQGVEQSLHFLLQNTAETIVRGDEPLSREGIRYMRDFRSNLPRSFEGKKYTAYDFKDGGEVEFPTHFEQVKYDELEQIAGYVSDTPTGGVVEKEKEKRYVVSVLSWFFLVTPTILIDKNNSLSSQVNEFQKRVKGLLGGKPPLITRCQQKMSKAAFKRLQKSFI